MIYLLAIKDLCIFQFDKKEDRHNTIVEMLRDYPGTEYATSEIKKEDI